MTGDLPHRHVSASGPAPGAARRALTADGRRMTPVRDGRPLKRWRYVGVYAPDLMICAGRVSIGGAPQSFWAVWDREAGRLYERTRMVPGRVRLPDGLLAVRERDVQVDLRVRPEGDAVDVTSPHGGAVIWTRKRCAAVAGTVTVDGRVRRLEGRAVIDDSAGYHARETAWEWSAGIGATADGVPLTWNLVAGVHDADRASERTVWVDGVAREVAPVRFSETLDRVHGADGTDLAFAAEAERARDDRVGPIRSTYRQPFGTFGGSLPGGLDLAAGFGVMERHRARW